MITLNGQCKLVLKSYSTLGVQSGQHIESVVWEESLVVERIRQKLSHCWAAHLLVIVVFIDLKRWKCKKASQTCTDMVQGDTTLHCIILASYIANAVMIKTEQYRAVENTILRNWWSFSQGKFKHRVFFLRKTRPLSF